MTAILTLLKQRRSDLAHERAKPKPNKRRMQLLKLEIQELDKRSAKVLKSSASGGII